MTHVPDLPDLLASVLPASAVVAGEAASDDYHHDESLTGRPQQPAVVVKPATTAEVAAVMRVADEHRVPVTPRGAGTGLSGACIPRPGGIVLSTERMNRVLEVDDANHVAVVQPGVTLDQLDDVLSDHGLVYSVYPGENSATIGGNIATNAGGMRAVKHGVTRHHVLGLEMVLAGGEVLRTGGKFVKATSGYDLTQIVIGSEGTLAVVTEAVLRLLPRPEATATVLAPFGDLQHVADAVPKVVASGVGPLILEYIDMLSMAATTRHVGLDLAIPDEVRDRAVAYLVVVVEIPSAQHAARLDEDVADLAGLLCDLGALDVYVLPSAAAAQLLEARESAFWVAKQNGAHDIVDIVVPRSAIPEFLATASEIAGRHGALVAGAGHAGDGNVHLSVFQPDSEARERFLHELFEAGLRLGGAVSAEHGIGLAKREHLAALEDPAKLALMRRIKEAFDPHGILGPGNIFALS